MSAALPSRPITLSLHALGGQGGGVLADWIVAAAHHAGWIAQSTSVPGVAQRTGATVYYVELFPAVEPGKEPLFALMPSPGDVDIVIAAELMEAGRAINRGLVTGRTTLIMSTSRIYAVSEKSGLGDGRLNSKPILDVAEREAEKLVAFDMEQEAARLGCVVSILLFGALAASGALPFSRDAFESAIEASKVSVAANLRAFARAYEMAQASIARVVPLPALLSSKTSKIIKEGRKRMIDYQDRAYAVLYDSRLELIRRLESHSEALTQEVARYLALWMSYEDTIRIADLKTRGARFARVRMEVGARNDQIVQITEYLHPRVEEICDTLPARLGAFIMTSPRWRAILHRLVARGRLVRTSGLAGFCLLYCIAGLRRWRRSSLRFQTENAKIESWLGQIRRAARFDYDLAVEIARLQKLVKGYGDTYERGWRNFSRISGMAQELKASEVATLRDAALADDQGTALAAAIRKLKPIRAAVDD
jgi:indolepyruvate ferredoxin oxidoreductase beta subunit